MEWHYKAASAFKVLGIKPLSSQTHDEIKSTIRTKSKKLRKKDPKIAQFATGAREYLTRTIFSETNNTTLTDVCKALENSSINISDFQDYDISKSETEKHSNFSDFIPAPKPKSAPPVTQRQTKNYDQRAERFNQRVNQKAQTQEPSQQAEVVIEKAKQTFSSVNEKVSSILDDDTTNGNGFFESEFFFPVVLTIYSLGLLIPITFPFFVIVNIRFLLGFGTSPANLKYSLIHSVLWGLLYKYYESSYLSNPEIYNVVLYWTALVLMVLALIRACWLGSKRIEDYFNKRNTK